MTQFLLTALPLTAAAFAPFGRVIEHPEPADDASAVGANMGTAVRTNHVADPSHLARPLGSPAARPNVAMFRCQPQGAEIEGGGIRVVVRLLERHPFSSQLFAPLAPAATSLASLDGYLVVVAPSLAEPPHGFDISGLTAFYATPSQGVEYAAGTWHHPMVTLGCVRDYVCLVWENGVQEQDCEVALLPEEYTVIVPNALAC